MKETDASPGSYPLLNAGAAQLLGGPAGRQPADWPGIAALLQNAILLVLSVVGFMLIHLMILREEKHLATLHPQDYQAYCQRVARYLF